MATVLSASTLPGDGDPGGDEKPGPDEQPDVPPPHRPIPDDEPVTPILPGGEVPPPAGARTHQNLIT